MELVGFVPLSSVPRSDADPASAFSDTRVNADKKAYDDLNDEAKLDFIRDKKRFERLILFAEYLCGLEQVKCLTQDLHFTSSHYILFELFS